MFIIYSFIVIVHLQALEKPARLPGQPAPTEQQEAKQPGAGQAHPPATSKPPQSSSGVHKDEGQSPPKPVSMHLLNFLMKA